MITGENDIGFL